MVIVAPSFLWGVLGSGMPDIIFEIFWRSSCTYRWINIFRFSNGVLTVTSQSNATRSVNFIMGFYILVLAHNTIRALVVY
ncbi:hypothetical protein KSS87_022390 [Heliosperma pusillum]|nr:hypothetical protein KSS87_022390 [Heliosperma pusillum]